MSPPLASAPPAAWGDVLWRTALRALSPAGPRAGLSVLIFHRVLPTVDPLFPDEPDAERFDALCGWLRAWFNVLPLAEAAARLERGALPERAAAITFDDGYADNHDVALPILRRHGLHATFFIATGYLDGGRMWNDTVVESIRRTRHTRLDAAALGLSGGDVLALDGLESRRAAIARVLPQLKYRPHAQRVAMAERLAEMAEVELPTDLMMDQARLQAMAGAGMDLGGHTVNHPILATLDDAQAQSEIERGRHELRERSGCAVDLFAYPNGRPGQDFLDRDALLARAAGFRAAVTTAPGAARQNGSDPFRLPRFTPWDRPRGRFAARMVRNLAQS